jgi:hypothetical protein
LFLNPPPPQPPPPLVIRLCASDTDWIVTFKAVETGAGLDMRHVLTVAIRAALLELLMVISEPVMPFSD